MNDPVLMKNIKPDIHVIPSLGDSVFETFLLAMNISVQYPETSVNSRGQTDDEKIKFKNGELIKGKEIFEHYRTLHTKGIEGIVGEIRSVQEERDNEQ